MDGEASREHVARRSKSLQKRLGELFAELGRKVDEVEAFMALRNARDDAADRIFDETYCPEAGE